MGLARSGLAAAQLLHELGASVTVNDQAPREKYRVEAELLDQLGIRSVFGAHPLELIHECDVIVKNPGIPYQTPLLQLAQAHGIPIVTEVEVAGAVNQSPLIGITGTNGKTTSTTLVGEMFKAAEQPAVLAGNIGTALSSVVRSNGAKSWIVAELSSFQLAGTIHFHPRIAALLNLTPAHLDYHETFAEYQRAKLRLFANQVPGDIAILPADQPDVAALVSTMQADVWWWSMAGPVRPGVYVDEQKQIVFAPPDLPEVTVCVLAVAEFGLPGAHNLANALAASTIALAAGLPLTAVRSALRAFKGVEHRLEFVRSVRAIKWYNDTKATNPEAAIQALSSFAEPLIAILGGLERGDDLTPLVPVLREHVRCAICIGESGDRMADVARLAGVPHVARAQTLAEAVALAAELGRPGEVALLSPAAASWDMFTSYEQRGRIFKDAVHML